MNILYITNSSYPSSTAHANRIKSLCLAAAQEGRYISILSPRNTSEDKGIESNLPIIYYGSNLNGRIGHILNLIFTTAYLIKAISKLKKPDVIIFTGAYARLSIPMLFIKKIFNVKTVIAEVCEWYDITQFKYGRINPSYWINKISREKILNFADGFIVISKFLEDFYKRKQKKVILIPAIVDFETNKAIINNYNDKIKFIYAGHPGKNKDQIQPIISAYVNHKSIYENSMLNLVGISHQYLLELLKQHNILNPEAYNIKAHGKISIKESRDLVKSSDFSILIRDVNINSMAGFPTKVAESLALGIPIISNNTSDIFFYAEEIGSIIKVESTSEQSISESLMRASSMSRYDIDHMKESAKINSKKFFHWSAYVDQINSILDK